MPKRLNLRRIRHQVLIVKDGKKYYLTNNLEQSSSEVKRFYRMRQQIEEIFRLLKQEFGWSKCRVGSLQGQKAHRHLGLYAFCLVQNKAIENNQTIYAFKQALFREPIPLKQTFCTAYSHCVISVSTNVFVD